MSHLLQKCVSWVQRNQTLKQIKKNCRKFVEGPNKGIHESSGRLVGLVEAKLC